jgi:hypothetical protein
VMGFMPCLYLFDRSNFDERLNPRLEVYGPNHKN